MMKVASSSGILAVRFVELYDSIDRESGAEEAALIRFCCRII